MSGTLVNGEIKTIAEQIYSIIRHDILQHKLKGGEKLTMKMLQNRLGVSSSPIREALTRLQQEGLVEYQPNIGMRVMCFTPKNVSSIYALMRELECAALRFSSESPEFGKMLKDMRELQDAAATKLKEGDQAGWLRLSDKFHKFFYDYADNIYLHDAASKIITLVVLFSNSYQLDTRNQPSIHEEHEEILRYLENGQISEAETALRKHLTASEKMALKVLEQYDTTDAAN